MKFLEKISAIIILTVIIILSILDLFYTDTKNYNKYREMVLDISTPFIIYFFISRLVKFYRGYKYFFKK